MLVFKTHLMCFILNNDFVRAGHFGIVILQFSMLERHVDAYPQEGMSIPVL